MFFGGEGVCIEKGGRAAFFYFDERNRTLPFFLVLGIFLLWDFVLLLWGGGEEMKEYRKVFSLGWKRKSNEG